jgi:hypothetical protein
MLRLLALPLLLIIAVPAASAATGRLDTLPVGEYRCELPGDATGPSRFPVLEESFEIRNASSYANAAGAGSYLLIGDKLVMTGGPKRGSRYLRLSDNFLRKIDATGEPGTLRCVRRTRNGG